jgi:hypothetical protein
MEAFMIVIPGLGSVLVGCYADTVPKADIEKIQKLAGAVASSKLSM